MLKNEPTYLLTQSQLDALPKDTKAWLLSIAQPLSHVGQSRIFKVSNGTPTGGGYEMDLNFHLPKLFTVKDDNKPIFMPLLDGEQKKVSEDH